MASGVLKCVFSLLLASAVAGSTYGHRGSREYDEYDLNYSMEYDGTAPNEETANPRAKTFKEPRQLPPDENTTDAAANKKDNKPSRNRGNGRSDGTRSIPLTSKIHNVQEKEMKRLRNRPVESVHRAENGSYKIVNSPGKRRGRRQAESNPVTVPDTFAFPGETSPPRTFIPQIPKECKEMGVCENVPNYPTERVASLLEQLGEAKNRFKVEDMYTLEFANRNSPEETELCESNEKIMAPQAAPDKDGKWYYILNQKDQPLQGIRVEICKNDMGPCSALASFYTGYRAYCKQKYVLRYMTSIEANGQLSQRFFKLPSCCSCVVQGGL